MKWTIRFSAVLTGFAIATGVEGLCGECNKGSFVTLLLFAIPVVISLVVETLEAM